jgi:hypothetical protein
VPAESSVPAESPAASEPSEAFLLASELTRNQQRVLEQLSLGTGISQVSRTTGVPRRSISRWVNEDPKFIAALNAWKSEQLEFGRASALAMTGDIMGTLRNGVREGDTGIAYRMAHSMGMLAVSNPGPTDADEVQRQREIRRARRDQELLGAKHERDPDLRGRVQRRGIAWTRRALRRLSGNEQSLLKFFRDKAAGREHRDCSEFSPLDHDRHLTDWERQVLVKAREQVVLEGNILFHGHVLPVPRGTNGTLIHYSKRQMFNLLRKGGVKEDEAMQLLANYRRPHPGFYEPDDLPYAEDEENGEAPVVADAPQAVPEQPSPENATASDAVPTPPNG